MPSSNDSTYRFPSGPVSMSVMPPNPLPKVIADNSSSLSTTRSDKPACCWVVSRLIPSLFSFTSKKYKFPLTMSPTKILFVYLSPRFEELKNSISVGATGSAQLKSGSA